MEYTVVKADDWNEELEAQYWAAIDLDIERGNDLDIEKHPDLEKNLEEFFS